MNNYLNPKLNNKLREVSAKGLAYIGDAVFGLMVRTYVLTSGTWTGAGLHGKTVAFVSAKSQAVAFDSILPLLSGEEIEMFKRGRNTHTGNVPKNSNDEEYRMATGMETLFGYLYLSGNIKRLNEIFEAVIESREQ